MYGFLPKHENFGILFGKVNVKKLLIHGWAQHRRCFTYIEWAIQDTIDIFDRSYDCLINQHQRQSYQLLANYHKPHKNTKFF